MVSLPVTTCMNLDHHLHGLPSLRLPFLPSLSSLLANGTMRAAARIFTPPQTCYEPCVLQRIVSTIQSFQWHRIPPTFTTIPVLLISSKRGVCVLGSVSLGMAGEVMCRGPFFSFFFFCIIVVWKVLGDDDDVEHP